MLAIPFNSAATLIDTVGRGIREIGGDRECFEGGGLELVPKGSIESGVVEADRPHRPGFYTPVFLRTDLSELGTEMPSPGESRTFCPARQLHS